MNTPKPEPVVFEGANFIGTEMIRQMVEALIQCGIAFQYLPINSQVAHIAVPPKYLADLLAIANEQVVKEIWHQDDPESIWSQ